MVSSLISWYILIGLGLTIVFKTPKVLKTKKATAPLFVYLVIFWPKWIRTIKDQYEEEE
jgi:hypothetical protein